MFSRFSLPHASATVVAAIICAACGDAPPKPVYLRCPNDTIELVLAKDGRTPSAINFFAAKGWPDSVGLREEHGEIRLLWSPDHESVFLGKPRPDTALIRWDPTARRAEIAFPSTGQNCATVSPQR